MKVNHKKLAIVFLYTLLYVLSFIITEDYLNKSDRTENNSELTDKQVSSMANKEKFKLGNEVLFEKYSALIEGKKIGLITNQTGVNSKGESIIDILYNYKSSKLVALYAPEHGIDGKAKAGLPVKTYTHPKYNIPVYSLYGDTRRPTKDMLKNINLLIYDMQDIGVRTYTYISTLNYCMAEAAKYNIPIMVLDRPNPLGGMLVEGPVLEDSFKSFVGVDNLPMIHGMTIGELAKFFNRNLGSNLKVIPMEGYNRSMIYEDTGLKWVQSSPNIPDIKSVFLYCATGLGEGTGITQKEFFSFIGGENIKSKVLADKLNSANLKGVYFVPMNINNTEGVRVQIINYEEFKPFEAGISILYYAKKISDFKIPKSGKDIVMFDKIMGTDKIGEFLEKGYDPSYIEDYFKEGLDNFKRQREQYLIYK